MDQHAEIASESRKCTSGYPVGSRKCSGTPAAAVFSFGVEDGGDGFAVYSVKDRLPMFGVWGVWVPLVLESSAMADLTPALEVDAYRSYNVKRRLGVIREICSGSILLDSCKLA